MDTEAPTAELDNQVAAEPVQEPAQQQEQAKPYDPEDFYAHDKPKGDQQAPAEGEQQDEEGEGNQQADEKPIAPPLSWAKDAKDEFAKLPRATQEIIATRERDRETFLQTKSREAAQTRQTVETEARAALKTIMDNHVQQLQPILQQIMPQQPDLRLLNSDDPQHRTLYFQQEAAYRDAVAQQTQVSQQLQEAQRNAELIAQHQRQAEIEAEHEVLNTALGTEWSDPSARAKLLDTLQPIAAELGYPQELIAQARAPDIIALRRASEWKAKAEKLDQLNKAKMVLVRADKSIPPTARTGSPAGQQAPMNAVDMLYPNDRRN